MDRATAIEKVKKCLNLARCVTAAEAATAAAMAQRLIDKFNIESALLEETVQEIKEDPTIIDMVIYEFSGPRVISWPLTLASGLGRVNGCKIWWSKRGGKASVKGAGRKADLETISYMLHYFVNEVERLCEEGLSKLDYKGGKSWTNSFKMGAVIEISDRLKQVSEETKQELRDPSEAYRKAIACNDIEKIMELDKAPKYELAVVEKAIAKLDERNKQADDWLDNKRKAENWSWKTRSKAEIKRYDAFEAGKEAGKKIELKPGKGLPCE